MVILVAEHAGPFAEGKIGGDDDGRSLVEPADEMEQQLSAGSGERQGAEFVEDDEVRDAVRCNCNWLSSAQIAPCDSMLLSRCVHRIQLRGFACNRAWGFE